LDPTHSTSKTSVGELAMKGTIRLSLNLNRLGIRGGYWPMKRVKVRLIRT
jgi:hypothetical protein